MMTMSTKCIFVFQSLFEQASVVVQLQSSGEPVDTADGFVTLCMFSFKASGVSGAKEQSILESGRRL